MGMVVMMNECKQHQALFLVLFHRAPERLCDVALVPIANDDFVRFYLTACFFWRE